MKVSAGNQSLILANDGPTGGKASAPASQVSSVASSVGSASATGWHRLTVVAELPDSTVVTLHADYAGETGARSHGHRGNLDRVVSSQTPSAVQFGPSDAGVSAAPLVQLSSPAYNTLLRGADNSRDTAGNPHTSNERVALYARTQRSASPGRSASLLDVHA